MLTFWQDLRFALRLLRSKPGFTAIAVLTLALGIGANSAIFSVVDSMLYRPLAGAKEADRLVSITVQRGDFSFAMDPSYPAYQDYKGLEQAFSDAAAHSITTVRLRDGANEPQRVWLSIVSGNYFKFLGVEAAPGRVFLHEEAERMGAGNVLVLTHEAWKSRFAGDPSVVGRTVEVNGHPFQVLGVAPEQFRGTSGIIATEGYIPVTAGDQLGEGVESWLKDRNGGGFNVIARLQPGVGLEQARAAAETLAARLADQWPDSDKGLRPVLHPESMSRIEPAAADYLPPIAAVFLILVGLVLLIACANVANLLLVRGIGRRRELAVRAAVGAGRLRIVRQLLTESLVLALAGGAVGLLLAYWATDLLSSVRVATDFPLRFDFRLSPTVFLYAFALAALSGLIAGLVPALQVSRTDLAAELKAGGGRLGSAARSRLRSALVVLQLAVSLVLLASAGLFVRSMLNVAGMDLGFALDHRLMMTMDAELAGLDQKEGERFYRELLAGVRSLPGVRAASTARSVPFGFGAEGDRIYVEGRDTEPADAAFVMRNRVGDDYFRTMGTTLLQGRGFGEQDREDTPGVAVVNEQLGSQLWPGESPLGKRISIEGSPGPWLEVVGVTQTGLYLLPGEDPRPYLYLPVEQHYRAERILHLWTEGEPEALIPEIRRRISTLAPQMPVYDVRTMQTHIREGKATVIFELGSELVGAFGLIGLVLAGVGLYGVMAFAVGQRKQEFGIRAALGAPTWRILRQVLGHGMALALLGVALGLVAAIAVTSRLTHLLVGVGPRDPLVLGGVAGFLLLVALLASLVPALRATSSDPMLALRGE